VAVEVEAVKKKVQQAPTAEPDTGTGLALIEAVNSVHLIGRLSGAPERKELPSGTELVTFRLVVDRMESERTDRRTKVDVIDCVVWRPRVQRQSERWSAGDVIDLDGALRKRFFRTVSASTASRTEVEVLSARLVRRAAA
jgi:single-strand DNA-binding protein